MQLPQRKYGPVAALAILAAAWGLLQPLLPIPGAQWPYAPFVPGSMLAAWVFGSLAGARVTLGGLCIALYFYAVPSRCRSGSLGAMRGHPRRRWSS
ncbi:MAG TPA: hypothetical protein VM074_07640 [Solimonas sp.]|nr:hypothetical protein [Solimonas sp.]